MVLDRQGVESVEIKKVGRKGRPFTLESLVDCEDYADGHYWLTVYQQLIDDDAVEIVQGGVSGDDNGYRVNVLDVTGKVIRLAGSVGYGFSTAGEALLIAQWTLIAVPLES
jgi:hypothetical protein